MRQSFVALVTVVLVLTASACGSHSAVRLRRGTIEVPGNVRASSLVHGVLGIRVGSTADELHRILGTPFAKVTSQSRSGRADTCWAYRASQPHSSMDALDFCINSTQRVDRNLVGVHG